MKKSLYLAFTSLILSLLFTGAPLAQEAENEVLQDKDQARAYDIGLLAKESGQTEELAEKVIEFQKTFAKYATEVADGFPNQISAIWCEPFPGIGGHIQFTGEVPNEATSKLEPYLDVLDPENIVLTGNGMITMQDQKKRAETAALTLKDLGYENLLTFYDPVDNVIQIELKIPEDAPQPDKIEFIDPVRNRLQADEELKGKAAEIDASDLELTIIRGTGPIVQEAHAIGGVWLRDDNVRECTGSWTVIGGPNWDKVGILTAGHCYGLNQAEVPGHPLDAIQWEDEAYNLQGDVEWHSSFSDGLTPDFYADAYNIRRLYSTMATSSMVGQSVCMYGRSSNYRSCNKTIQATGLTVLAGAVPGYPATTVGNLARTSNNTMIGGDSGCGWSWNNTAYGVAHGWDGSNRSYFTPVDEAQDALDVWVCHQI